MELWQVHARASFSALVLIFRISIEFFYIYYVWPGLFLVPVSFGPGTFNGQDPPGLVVHSSCSSRSF
ncbi:hypothetical protein HanPSC8_Chr08g0316661 [Helianthus annuus]|nr:hypothetical protein HanPSC8_Chr08g0316661 [Helianthus annuus]